MVYVWQFVRCPAAQYATVGAHDLVARFSFADSGFLEFASATLCWCAAVFRMWAINGCAADYTAGHAWSGIQLCCLSGFFAAFACASVSASLASFANEWGVCADTRIALGAALG